MVAVGRSGIGPGPLYILDPSFRLRRAEFRLKCFLISVGCVSFSNCVEGWGRILFEFGPCGWMVETACFPNDSRDSNLLCVTTVVLSCSSGFKFGLAGGE